MSARAIRQRLTPYVLVLPGWLWLVIFFVVPALTMLSVSTMTGDDLNGFKQTSTSARTWTRGTSSTYRSSGR